MENPLLDKLLIHLGLLDAGCPVGRWELTNLEWRLLGTLKNERETYQAEKMREDNG